MEEKHKQFLQALEKQYGTIADACRTVGITRTTYYRWLENAEFKEAVSDLQEELKDNAESKMHQLINGVTMSREVKGEEIIYSKAPDAYMIQFFLKTKAKERGYVEKVESENVNKNDNTIKIVIDYGESES